jgi:hypothetical protein
MNTRQLIEAAAMDALGLLSREEREEFEQALRAAPPHVQAEVRREQRRTADAELANLPEVQPPGWLRFRVISAVRDAIARTTPASASEERPAERSPFTSAWSSANAWRVAAIALASASVTLGIFNLAFRSEIKDLDAQLDNRNRQEAMTGIAQKFPDVFLADDKQEADLAVNPNLTIQSFNNNRPVEARVMASANANACVLLVRNLPVHNGRYRVVLLNDQGNRDTEVRTFTFSGTHDTLPLDIQPDQITRLAIVGPATEGGIDRVILAARFA